MRLGGLPDDEVCERVSLAGSRRGGSDNDTVPKTPLDSAVGRSRCVSNCNHTTPTCPCVSLSQSKIHMFCV